MHLRVPVPAALADNARAYVAGKRLSTQLRDAATVVLLRDGAAALEVYLLQRRSTMAFAAGMSVFPGGGVDLRDADAEIAWAGPDARTWALCLRCDEGQARALVCAAVRETFEESGVLLAGPDVDTVVSDTTGVGWEADRLALVDRSLSLSALMARRGLVLRADLLGAWARWVTPEFEPRRYDTRFFVAVLPDGQRTRDVSTEAATVQWASPAAAVGAVDAGAMVMLPPTYETCRQLLQLGTAAQALAAAEWRSIEPVEPRLVVDGESLLLEVELP